jgi:hypothetical protein
MNYSLLPSVEKNAFKREYRIRLAIIACFLFAAAGIVGIAELFPAYLHSSVEEKDQLESLASIKKGKDESGISAIEQSLASDSALMTSLASGTTDIRLSTVIQSLATLRGTVRLDSISVARSSPTTLSIIIQGVAPNRESLRTLKARLEQLQPGNVVDLPASEFASSANIRFSVRVTETIQ